MEEKREYVDYMEDDGNNNDPRQRTLDLCFVRDKHPILVLVHAVFSRGTTKAR